MQVLFAVLDDLFRFALQSLFGSVVVNGERKAVAELPKPLQPLLPLLPSGKKKNETVELVSAQGSYFVSVEEACLRIDPVAAYDNVLTTLFYGTQVKVLKYGGRWAMVQYRDISGWILKDMISGSAEEVFPRFVMGAAYDSGHQVTRKLRLCIKDAFNCSEPGIPLTGAEYVTYNLLRRQRQISWPDSRPRLPGQWQSILRGRGGIHIGILPKTGAVMECVREDEGCLLYVEAVFPDESIQVSSVDYAGTGIYSEDVLPKETWRELRPVFIEVT